MPTLRAVLVVAVLAFAPCVVAAEENVAPSQRLETDARTPAPIVAVRVDAVALFRKVLGIEIDLAAGRWQSIALLPAVWRSDVNGLGLDVAYRLRPMGRGLDGLLVQASAGIVASLGQTRERFVRVGAELGYTALVARASFGASMGVERRWALDPIDVRRLVPSVRLLVGYAFG